MIHGLIRWVVFTGIDFMSDRLDRWVAFAGIDFMSDGLVWIGSTDGDG
jgi:hypothetical protein